MNIIKRTKNRRIMIEFASIKLTELLKANNICHTVYLHRINIDRESDKLHTFETLEKFCAYCVAIKSLAILFNISFPWHHTPVMISEDVLRSMANKWETYIKTTFKKELEEKLTSYWSNYGKKN